MAVTTIRGGRQIADATIPYADIQNVTANTVLANNTASATTIQEVALASNTLLGRGSTGNITAITVSGGLSFSGSVLSSSGGISGSTGSVDNAILRADGTGGSTLQASNVFINDIGSITLGTSSNTTSPFTIKADGVGTSDISLYLESNRNGSVRLSAPGTIGGSFVSRLEVSDLSIIGERKSTSANDVLSVLSIYRSTTSTVQAGIGGSLQFVTQTSLTPNYETGGIIESISTSVTAAAESFDLVFRTMAGGAAAAERLRITSAGQLNVQSSINIASSGLVLSQGRIQFPATANVIADANALDDYEEGSWSPTFVSSTGSFTTLTYGTARAGRYQKIGNRVYISGILTTNSVTLGTAAGDLRIGGLPFTMSSATTPEACMITFTYVLVWASEPPSTGIASTTSAITLYRKRDTTTDEDVALQPNDMTTGASTGANECWFFGFYNTSS